MYTRQDVLPTVLGEDVMKHEQSHYEQGDAEQRGPGRDLPNCVRNCQAAYRIRAFQRWCIALSTSAQKLIGLAG